MNLETFIQHFRNAINEVDSSYYGSKGWNNNLFHAFDIDEYHQKYKALKKFLNRYGERVFCYELYHQTRLQMEIYSRKNSAVKNDFTLQAELKKAQIQDVLKFFPEAKEGLDKEYIPDFLLHSPEPGNFRHQMIVIEVKSNPQLSFSDIRSDLLKIQEFITKYQYRLGIFLTVNTSPETMKASLTKSENITWMHENLPDQSNILFMCKEKQDSPLFECNLADLLFRD